jgi:hypothetical protein
MAKNDSGFGCLTVLLVALIAHSCGEDEGKQAARRQARTEIETLESKVRQLERTLEDTKRDISNGCPHAEEPPHTAR